MSENSNLFYDICDIYYLSQTILSYITAAGNKCSQRDLYRHLFGSWLDNNEQKYSDPGTVSKLFNAQLRFNDNILTDLKSTYRQALASDIRNNIFPLIPNHTQMLEEICTFLKRDIMHPKAYIPEKFERYKDLITSHLGSYFLTDTFEWAKAAADWEAELLADILLFAMEYNFYRREGDRQTPLIPIEHTNPPVNSTPLLEGPFYGREKELESLNQLLQEKKHVFVSGFSGIGKSELVKKYIMEMRPLYNRILYISYSGSLEKDLQDLASSLNHSVSFSGVEVLPYWARLNLESAHMPPAIEMLKQLSDRDLIIVDNLDALPFEHSSARCRSLDVEDRNLYGTELFITPFLDLPCKILITTRCDYSQKCLGYSDHCLKLSCLDPETLRHFFDGNDFYTSKDKSTLNKIIDCLEKNTFLIKLTERLLSTGNYNVQQIWNHLQESPLNVHNDTHIAFRHWGTSRYDTFGQHIRLLLSLFELSDRAENILINLSLMPDNGIQQDLFESWIDLYSHSDVDVLCSLGLVKKFSKYKTNYLAPLRLIAEIYKEDKKMTIDNAQMLLSHLSNVCVHHLGQEENDNECRACSEVICSVCSKLLPAADFTETQQIYDGFIENAIPFQLLYNQSENVKELLYRLDYISKAEGNHAGHLLYLLITELFFPTKTDSLTDSIQNSFSLIHNFISALPQAAKDSTLMRFVYNLIRKYSDADKNFRKSAVLTFILDNINEYSDSKYVRLFCYPIFLYYGQKDLLKQILPVSSSETCQSLSLPSDFSQKIF